MNKILITGCNGTIGKFLTDRLIQESYEVIGVDIIDIRNKNSKLMFYQNDINILCNSLLKNEKFDYIFHLATPIQHPRNFGKETHQLINCNINTSLKLAEYSKKYNTKIFFASTSEVYGKTNNTTYETNTGDINNLYERSIYANSKRLGETIISTISNNWVIGRLHNTYGEHFHNEDKRIIPNMIKSILNNNIFEIYGNGKTVRSYCYVNDMVNQIIKLTFNYNNTVCNLGNPYEEYSIDEVVDLMSILCPDFQFKYSDKNLVPGETNYRRLYTMNKNIIPKISEMVSLKEGLTKVLNYHKII